MDASEARTFNIRHLVAAAGGPTEFGKVVLRDQVQVSQWISERSTKPIGHTLARYIESAIGKPKGWLDQPQFLADEAARPVSFREDTVTYSPSTKKRVPVRGTASMGMDGFWVDLDYPPGMGDGYFEHDTSDPDAYVLRVKGDSMFPAIRSGWYVLVEPNGEIHQGEYVLVKLADGRSTVKELLWHRNGEYSLLAIASGDRLTVSEAEVTGIHPIAAVLPPSKRRE